MVVYSGVIGLLGSLTVTGGYANRAHNDLAEILLETGVIGAFLLLVFLGWFLRRAVAVWRWPTPDPAQTMLERSAILIIGLLLAHSLGKPVARMTLNGRHLRRVAWCSAIARLTLS